MVHTRIYTMDPEPDGLAEIEIAKLLGLRGISFQPHDPEVFLRLALLERLRAVGPTKATTMAGALNEAVLPDGRPRSVLIEEIRLKVALCKPDQSFLLIDPYLYPQSLTDPRYVQDLLYVLDDVIRKCAQIEVITKASRNRTLEGQVVAAVAAANPQLRVTQKYSDVFHDRFWIADGKRGIFVGTSLNGIGNRYALLDYLSEEDAIHIVHRAAQIP